MILKLKLTKKEFDILCMSMSCLSLSMEGDSNENPLYSLQDEKALSRLESKVRANKCKKNYEQSWKGTFWITGFCVHYFAFNSVIGLFCICGCSMCLKMPVWHCFKIYWEVVLLKTSRQIVGSNITGDRADHDF